MSDDQPLAPRVSALETSMASVQASLVAMEREATQHRTEEKAMLTDIAKEVREIKTEQILDRGRREGEASTRRPLNEWAGRLLPFVAAGLLYMLTSYIADRAAPPAMPPSIIINPPAAAANSSGTAGETVEEEIRTK